MQVQLKSDAIKKNNKIAIYAFSSMKMWGATELQVASKSSQPTPSP
jgi:hypothetical protein